MKPRRNTDNSLPPLPTNMGIWFYPTTVPIADIKKAIKRWDAGKRPNQFHRMEWPGLCRDIDAMIEQQNGNESK